MSQILEELAGELHLCLLLQSKIMLFFVLILNIQFNNFSVMSGWFFLGSTRNKQRIKCLAQGHNTVPPVRLKPTTPQSRVKHSTTELIM